MSDPLYVWALYLRGEVSNRVEAVDEGATHGQVKKIGDGVLKRHANQAEAPPPRVLQAMIAERGITKTARLLGITRSRLTRLANAPDED